MSLLSMLKKLYYKQRFKKLINIVDKALVKYCRRYQIHANCYYKLTEIYTFIVL